MKSRHIITVIVVLIALFATAAGFAQQQTYKVRQGDSLYKIGRMFNTTPETLKKLNDLENDKLNIGRILKVPAELPAASVKAAEAPVVQSSLETAANTGNAEHPQIQQAQQARKETQTYTVRQGDTISEIAKSFNIGLKDLTAANNIKNSNKLNIGQVLTIPGNSKTVAETPAAKPAEATSELAAAALRVASRADLKPMGKEEELTVRDRLVEAGFNMLGVRYRFGGTSEKTGLDCSALVKNLFDKFGFTLPRSSREQYKHGEKVAKEDLQKGDLVFFSSSGKTPTHVGIYIGNNQFLHAASRAKKVIISDLGKTWYDFRYLGARRIMELWWEEPRIPSDNVSFEWAHQLLDVWDDSQIPLTDTSLDEFAASVVPKEGL
ncbi:MAG: LysM peptidoglycan-binding domain-containing protein [Acidobacteria bacterium]|nr:LysM peptidoglycan-binding domain-containing protein [Acidobacteriota bacterium]